MVAATLNSELINVLNSVNGRRRTRLLSESNIINAAEELSPGEYTFLHGGHVANAYSYPAVATGAVVFRTEAGETYAIIREVNAKKGSTGFGRFDRWVAPKNPAEVAIAIG